MVYIGNVSPFHYPVPITLGIVCISSELGSSFSSSLSSLCLKYLSVVNCAVTKPKLRFLSEVITGVKSNQNQADCVSDSAWVCWTVGKLRSFQGKSSHLEV